MAIGVSEKKQQVRDGWNFVYRCHKCPAPLVGTVGLRLNNLEDPNDDEALCLNCAGLMFKQDVPPSYEGKAFLSGALLVGLIVVLIKWLM